LAVNQRRTTVISHKLSVCQTAQVTEAVDVPADGRNDDARQQLQAIRRRFNFCRAPPDAAAAGHYWFSVQFVADRRRRTDSAANSCNYFVIDDLPLTPAKTSQDTMTKRRWTL